MTDSAEKQTYRRTFVGKVVSNKMDKTIVIEVVRKVRHKLYKKYMKVTRKFHAHDESNVCGMGDVVKIAEHRPISKTKTWILEEVVEKAQ